MFATVHGCIASLEGRQSSPILGGRRHRHWLVSGLCGAVSRMLGPFGCVGQRMGGGEPVFGKLRCGQALGGCGVYGYT